MDCVGFQYELIKLWDETGMAVHQAYIFEKYQQLISSHLPPKTTKIKIYSIQTFPGGLSGLSPDADATYLEKYAASEIPSNKIT